MTTTIKILFLLFIFSLISCTDDDNSNTNNELFALEIGNSWKYEVYSYSTKENIHNPAFDTTQFKVLEEVLIDNEKWFKVEISTNGINNGIKSILMSNKEEGLWMGEYSTINNKFKSGYPYLFFKYPTKIGDVIDLNNSNNNNNENKVNNNFLQVAELMFFDARMYKGNVELQWATSSEENTAEFIIEKSLGSEDDNFSKIGKVQASGNSFLNAYYNFTDEDFVFNIDNNYRLTLVNLDGSSSNLSGIVTVHHNKRTITTVSLNKTVNLDIGTYNCLQYEINNTEKETYYIKPNFGLIKSKLITMINNESTPPDTTSIINKLVDYNIK